MSDSRNTLPTAACEVLDPATKQPVPTVKLCMFKPPFTAVETISRTLRYAQNPQQYLLGTLGEANFAARRHLFCLPKEGEEPTLDAYGSGTTKQAFEAHIAKFLGKEHGLFFLTGVQAQLAALKTYSESTGRHRVAWYVSSHLESAECDAYEKLYGLERVLLGAQEDILPTVEDIRQVLLQHGETLAAIVLEIPNRTLGCQTHSLADLRKIAQLCKESGVALHCDGARLWEVEPWYSAVEGVSFEQLCECFDSVYVSFYKGLGGLTGAMLVHDDAVFMEDAKLWQRRAGGNAFTLGVEVLDCERAFNESIGTFARKREKMGRIVEGIKAATKDYMVEGKAVVTFMPNTAVCSQILTSFNGYTAEELLEARDRVHEKTGVRVFERLRPVQSLDEKMKEDRMKVKFGKIGPCANGGKAEDARMHFVEWMIMSLTEKIDDAVFVGGYVALCKELITGKENT